MSTVRSSLKVREIPRAVTGVTNYTQVAAAAAGHAQWRSGLTSERGHGKRTREMNNLHFKNHIFDLRKFL